MRRGWRLLAFVSLLLLPVFWVGRPRSMDLPSHTYNVWLAQLIRQGEAPGLWIEPMALNTAFERLFDALLFGMSYPAAESAAFAVCVLVLGSGSALWVRAVAGRFPWPLAPLVLAAAHGFVTQAGFTNFMLAVGVAGAAGAALLSGGRVAWLAVPAGAAAVLANPMGAAMMLGLSAYIWSARRLELRRSLWLFAAAAAGIAAVGFWLPLKLPHTNVFHPVAFLGAATLIPYRLAYIGPALLFLLVAGLFVLAGKRRPGMGVPLQAWLLAVLACLALPNSVQFPGHAAHFGFIHLRLSLAVMLAMIAWLGTFSLPRWAGWGAALVAVSYFALLFQDHHRGRHVDALLREAVLALPPRSRVVLPHTAEGYLLDLLAGALERACLEHCHNYLNYEPPTKAFRIRAGAGNGIVESQPKRVNRSYFQVFDVGEQHLPIYVIEVREKRFAVRAAVAGERITWSPVPLP